jgi:hypothetical protein
MELIPYHKVSVEAVVYPTFIQNVSDGQTIGTQFYGRQINRQREFHGYRNPGYRRQIKRTQNATTPASGVIITIVCPYSTGYVEYKDPPHEYYRVQFTGCPWADLIGTPAYIADIDLEIMNNALTGFLKKCKRRQRLFQTGVFVGELREAISLVRKPALALRKLFDNYVGVCRRRARRLPLREQTRLISNQWLELQFGAIPLASDAKSAAEALAEVAFGHEQAYVTFIAGGELARSNSRTQRFVSQELPYVVDVDLRQEITCQYRGVVSVNALGYIDRKFAVFGTTLSDFIPTVYELIPYSFLVDYFTNIGEILEAASFCQADLKWHNMTVRRTILQTIRVSPNLRSELGNQSNLLKYSVSPCVSTCSEKSFSRSVPLLGIPSLAFKLPGLGLKALNIAALASLRVL